MARNLPGRPSGTGFSLSISTLNHLSLRSNVMKVNLLMQPANVQLSVLAPRLRRGHVADNVHRSKETPKPHAIPHKPLTMKSSIKYTTSNSKAAKTRAPKSFSIFERLICQVILQ